MTRIDPPASDPTQEVRGNLDGDKGHRFGNEYDSHDHGQPRHVAVGQRDGGVGIEPGPAEAAAGRNIPADAGRRAHVDQQTGAVHGSGAGAGGGTPGDDYEAYAAGGSGVE